MKNYISAPRYEISIGGKSKKTLYKSNDGLNNYCYLEKIKKAEANLHTILYNADAGYALYNSDLKLVSYNRLAQNFSKLLYSRELREGNHFLDYFPSCRHQYLLNITKRVLSGEEVNYEVEFDGLVDGLKWIDVKWISVKNSENKNWGFILVSKDITEIKLALIERERIMNDLSRSNKAFEQFTRITSHNLNAPVGNIISLAETFGELDDEAEKKEYLDFIIASAKSLNPVINDINQILQMKQHLSEIKDKINLSNLLESIKTIIITDIVKENVLIRSDFGDVTDIVGLRSYLHSIFYNLILNSIKYRKPNVSPEIDITATIRDNMTVFTFTDNGKGIDLEKNGPNLFGLYKRFDSSVLGRGLGLFMIKNQVEELGGTINVQSTLGAGTMFIIELPIIDEN
jgi:signal transduction histidine kinase